MIVDYSNPQAVLSSLKSAGVTDVMRYLSGGQSKDLTAGERDRLLAAGFGIGLVWETDGRTGPLMGTKGGLLDSASAILQARGLGVPAHTALYFAVDFDASADLPVIRNYFTAARAACHTAGYRVGAYGGLATIEGVHDLVDCGWQTYAWSGGKWSVRAQLQQYQNGVSMAGVDVDLNRATNPDFGQWKQGAADDMTAEEHTWLAAIFNQTTDVHTMALRVLDLETKLDALTAKVASIPAVPSTITGSIAVAPGGHP